MKRKSKDYNMKRIVLATALIAASSIGAFAQTAPVELSSSVQSQIMWLVPGAGLSNLTASQYAQIVSLFPTSDNLSLGSNPSRQIKAILGAQ